MPPTPPQLTLLVTPRTVTFRGKVVPQDVVRRAESVLEDFNHQAGTRYQPYKGNGSAAEALTRILGRLLEHPDVDGHGWHRVIRTALTDPWWTGRPSVGVVFGPRVVENYLAAPLDDAPPIENDDARRLRETRERRRRQRSILARLRGDPDGAGSGGQLPAS